MFSEGQKEYLKIEDVELILNSYKQVISISFDGSFYKVNFGSDLKNAMVKFAIKDKLITEQELLNVHDSLSQF